MLLFQKRFHEGLKDGSVSVTFRRWTQLRVKVGGRYRCHPIGVLEVDQVTWVPWSTVTDADARLSGFENREALAAYLSELGPLEAATSLVRIELHHGGDGDRVTLALEDTLSADDIALIGKKLQRMDGKSPWVFETLALIVKHPRVAASKLALKVGRETLPFKTDVRKLKKLGLTQSFEVGYEVSPRGKAFLEKFKAPTPVRGKGKASATKRAAPAKKRTMPAARGTTASKAKPRTKR